MGINPCDGQVKVEDAPIFHLRCRLYHVMIEPVGGEAHYVFVHTILYGEQCDHLRLLRYNALHKCDAQTALQDDGEPYSAIDRSCDGMDVAVYVVNEKQMTLTFAGANNPLVLIRNNEINLLKPNKMPVGIYARMNPFENTIVELQKGDCIYTFSDGFQDQFSSNNDCKFTGRRLRELLLKIHKHPMEEQKSILNSEYEQWRGPVSNQTDDVVIMGVRI